MILKKLFIILIFLFIGLVEVKANADTGNCIQPFTDIPCDFWAINEITWAKNRGITKGYPDGTYRPYEPIKRDAMAAFIVRALFGDNPTCQGGVPCESTQPYFKDVDQSQPFFRHIQKLYEAGVTKGWSDGTYRPYENIRRDAMAAFLIRALGYGDNPICSGGVPCENTQPYFMDVPQVHPFYKHIQKLKELGITRGCRQDPPMYCPDGYVTRDAMAVFLYRAFSNYNTVGNLTPILNLDQAAKVASSLGSIRSTSYYISNLFYMFGNYIGLGSAVSLTSADNLDKLFSSDNVLDSSIKILNKLANSDALHVLLTSIKDISTIKKVSQANSQTTFNCPDGGTYNYSGGENIYNVIINYNKCKMNDIQLDGSLKISGTESDFVMQIGTSSSPFSLLLTENNYSTPISKEEFQLTYNVNNFKFDLNTNNMSGSFTLDGSFKEYDYEDQSTSILNFIKLNEIFAFQFRNNIQANITGNGKVELSLINSSNVQKGVSYTYNNFKTGLIVDPNYEQYSIDGVVVVDYTPDFCYEGTFNFKTFTPIKYDNNLGHTVAGKIMVNDLTSITYNSDGSITVTTGNSSKTFSDEDELEDICYAF
jgi:hypothetical protein